MLGEMLMPDIPNAYTCTTPSTSDASYYWEPRGTTTTSASRVFLLKAQLRRQSSLPAVEIDMKTPQRALLLALEGGDIIQVRKVISRIPASKQMIVLLAPSKKPKHQLRTPLMAAAASGDLAIFGAVLEGFNKLFRGDNDADAKTKIQLRKDRNFAMQAQLQLVDIGGASLLMIAASTASVAVFNAVAHEVRPSQARKILFLQDVRGITYLMYAVNPEAMTSRPILECANLLSAEEGVFLKRQDQSPSASVSSIRPAPVSTVPNVARPEDPGTAQSEVIEDPTQAYAANPWVPVVKSVLEFAKKRLWKPEYRELLKLRDSWDRSIIEHSIVSGKNIVFDAVFDAIRLDIYDEEIEHMLEVGENTQYEQTAMRVAVNSQSGRNVANLVYAKTRHLKKDVSFRAEASTVSSKIQTFIPGNLIVIFQLLLPEMKDGSHTPLMLLAFLCCVAPIWAWGGSLVSKGNPERQNTLARVTWARHVLAFPSMFFWGVGTSTIGQYSFGWSDSMSAASLAVATIIIPAVDSFVSGKGARAFHSTIVIKALDIYDEVKDRLPSWAKSKEPWLFDDDDEWQTPSWLDQSRNIGVASIGVNTSPFDKRPYFPSTMEAKEDFMTSATGIVEEVAAASIEPVARNILPRRNNIPSRVQPSTLEVKSDEKAQDAAGDT